MSEATYACEENVKNKQASFEETFDENFIVSDLTEDGDEHAFRWLTDHDHEQEIEIASQKATREKVLAEINLDDNLSAWQAEVAKMKRLKVTQKQVKKNKDIQERNAVSQDVLREATKDFSRQQL